MKALSLLFLGLIVGVAYGQQHEVDARTPTTLLDEAGAAHQEQLRVEHQASMETLQQEGVTIITQDVTMNVDTPTRITFDYAAAAGQERMGAKGLSNRPFVMTLFPAKDAAGQDVTQIWVIDLKAGTATAQ